MDLNKVMLIGRLTKDPEVRTIPSGETVATFSVATGRTWIDKNSREKKSVSEFHNVVAWRKLGEIAGQYLKKGRQVYIEGRLQTRSWDDPSGNKRYRTEIIVENLIMLGKGDDMSGGNNSSNAYAPSNNPPAPQPTDDEETISIEDIPF